MKIRHIEKQNAKLVIAYASDFDEQGNDWTRAWQGAYFNLLSWKNTWGFASNLDIGESRKEGVFVRVVIPCEEPEATERADRLVEWMEEMGYRNIKVSDVDIKVIDIEERGDYAYEYYID